MREHNSELHSRSDLCKRKTGILVDVTIGYERTDTSLQEAVTQKVSFAQPGFW